MGTAIFLERYWQKGHFTPPYFKNSARENFWSKIFEFWEGLPNDCHSVDWTVFGKKKASLASKSQRRKKIWRWLFIFWRAYKTTKGHQIEAKNVHKTMVCVQEFGFFPSVLYLARIEKCSYLGIFRSRLPRNREQILFWKILTIFPISIHRVFNFVTTQNNLFFLFFLFFPVFQNPAERHR